MDVNFDVESILAQYKNQIARDMVAEMIADEDDKKRFKQIIDIFIKNGVDFGTAINILKDMMGLSKEDAE